MLARSRAPLELGLHFNLSEGAPLSAALRALWPTLPGLARLLALAHLRRLPLAAIGAEFRAQVDAFAEALGRKPAFVDGHQHVHALPGVRRIVLDGDRDVGRRRLPFAAPAGCSARAPASSAG